MCRLGGNWPAIHCTGVYMLLLQVTQPIIEKKNISGREGGKRQMLS